MCHQITSFALTEPVPFVVTTVGLKYSPSLTDIFSVSVLFSNSVQFVLAVLLVYLMFVA